MPDRLPYYCGIAALVFSSASTIITLLIAIALLDLRSSIWPLVIASTVLDIFTLAWIAYMLAGSVGSEYNNRRRRTETSKLIASILLSSVAALTTLASLVWIQLRPAAATGTIFGNTLFTLQEAEYGLLGASVILQALFTGLWTRRQDAVQIPSGPGPYTQPESMDQPQMRAPYVSQEFNPPMQLQPMTTRRSLASASSHSVASESSKAEESPRSSMHIHGPVRPMTSRSRLVRPHSWTPTSGTARTQSSSGVRAAHATSSAGGFAEWSRRPSEATQSTISCRSSSELSYSQEHRPETPTRTRLETIPGSRANSPARPLDGPFPAQTLPVQTESEEPIQRPMSTATENPEINAITIKRPALERFVTAPTSPQPTPDVDESNIHPLFRTASALPPPKTTAGTIVTASELAGRYMTPKSLHRATSRSRARGSLYDPHRARSHSRLGARARQQQLPIPHTLIRARSLETLDSWQTRLEEGDNEATLRRLAQLGLSKQKVELQGEEKKGRAHVGQELPQSLQVRIPEKRQSSNTSSSNAGSGQGTPRRALSETSGNIPTPKRATPKRSSPQRAKGTPRSSLNVQRRGNDAAPEFTIFIDPASP